MRASDPAAVHRSVGAALAAAGALEQLGYTLITCFVGDPPLRRLRADFDRLHTLNPFRPAGIGANGDFRTRTDVRGDKIFWVDRRSRFRARALRGRFRPARVRGAV